MTQNKTKAFDPTKPVQTRGGCKARILCTDRKHPTYPFVGVIEGETLERVICFTEDGLYCEGQECDDDLINTPPQLVEVFYRNVYDSYLGNTLIGRIKITVYDDNSFDVEKCDE